MQCRIQASLSWSSEKKYLQSITLLIRRQGRKNMEVAMHAAPVSKRLITGADTASTGSGGRRGHAACQARPHGAGRRRAVFKSKSGERCPLYLSSAVACLDDHKLVPKLHFTAVTMKKNNAWLRTLAGTLSKDRCRCAIRAGVPMAQAILPHSWWWRDRFFFLERNIGYKQPACYAGRALVSWGNR